MRDLDKWKRKLLLGRKGSRMLSAGMWFDGVYFPPKPGPSAIDLLGDLAVSDEERQLRIERRESSSVEVHEIDIVAPTSEPDDSVHPPAP